MVEEWEEVEAIAILADMIREGADARREREEMAAYLDGIHFA